MPLKPEQVELLTDRAMKESNDENTVVYLVLNDYGKNYIISKKEVLEAIHKIKNR